MVRTREAAAKRAEASRTNRPGSCQLWTRTLFAAPSAGDYDHDGDADAVDGWKSEPASARHTDRHPPRGVPVAYSGGSHGYGHRAISLGHGKIRSTDSGGLGRIATVDLDWPERHWGLHYLGWSETIDSVHIPGEHVEPKHVEKPKPIKPLPVDVVDLSHWDRVKYSGVRQAKKAGVRHFFLKATEGLDFVDAKYKENRLIVKAARGRSTGYHFARPRQSNGGFQALFFLSHAKIKPGSDDRIMLMLQDRGGLDRKELTEWVGDFVEEIEKVLGPRHYILTSFDLNKTFGWRLWVSRFTPKNSLPKIPEPWKEWDVRQFSNGIVGKPSKIPGFTKVHLSNVVGPTTALRLPKSGAPKPKPVKVPRPKPPAGALDFRVHLLPGNHNESATSIKRDMALVKKISGDSALLANTERETKASRQAVSSGLGKGWTRVIENENTIAYGPKWHQPTGGQVPSTLLLAKEDPSMAKVSPRRYLNDVTLEHEDLKGVDVKFKATHLLSEANCIHHKVIGRAWREKMYPVQIHDVITDLEKDHKAGFPQIVVGDFNTGVSFTGKQLFAMLQRKFGDKVKHVHNGGLDHIFVISTNSVRLAEQGVETLQNNASDHDMVTATIRATKL